MQSGEDTEERKAKEEEAQLAVLGRYDIDPREQGTKVDRWLYALVITAWILFVFV